MTTRPLIAIDLDDVLVAHYDVLFAHLNRAFGSDVGPGNWHARYVDPGDYARDWSVAEEDLVASVQALFEREDTFGAPLAGAVGALTRLRDTYRLAVVTARHQGMAQGTATWLEAHLPGLFEDVRLLGSESWGDGLRVEKTGALVELGASVLIDDHPRHCSAAAAIGVRAILFGRYGWNAQTPAGVERARDWDEVQRRLLPSASEAVRAS